MVCFQLLEEVFLHWKNSLLHFQQHELRGTLQGIWDTVSLNSQSCFAPYWCFIICITRTRYVWSILRPKLCVYQPTWLRMCCIIRLQQTFLMFLHTLMLLWVVSKAFQSSQVYSGSSSNRSGSSQPALVGRDVVLFSLRRHTASPPHPVNILSGYPGKAKRPVWSIILRTDSLNKYYSPFVNICLMSADFLRNME